MIEYSDESMLSYAALYSDYNDIDIFVEDKTLVGVYEYIFKRLIGNAARITSITPLNGRKGVLECARRLKSDRSRKRFFLLDGDFHWVKKRVPKIRDVYTLKCYSIENLIIEREAVVNVAHLHTPGQRRDAIMAQIPEEFLLDIADAFFHLFALYGFHGEVNGEMQTVSYSAIRLCSNTREGIICPDLTKRRIRELVSYLRANGKISGIKAYRTLLNNMKSRDRLFVQKFVSGKDYILPIVQALLTSKFNVHGDRNQLLFQLAAQSSLTNEPSLSNALLRRATAA